MLIVVLCTVIVLSSYALRAIRGGGVITGEAVLDV